ncbi:MAG: SGNH/GDSL hydrolase family protein [Akkermansiaceae bacterium]|nr:SGNH/GDSL hydrolase family protein [Akkermansiaceae bacterium]
MNPYCQSDHLNQKILPEVLAHGPYDVVHFNMGLHGWQEGRIKPGTFEPLTKGYVEVLRAAAKGTLIWASSTPVTMKDMPTELDSEINPVIIDHNRMAAKVMAEMDVPVNDFYALLVNHRDLARGDLHWTAPPPVSRISGEVRSRIAAGGEEVRDGRSDPRVGVGDRTGVDSGPVSRRHSDFNPTVFTAMTRYWCVLPASAVVSV